MFDVHFTRRGFMFLADKSDADIVKTRNWECFNNSKGRFYVRSDNVYLHRLLLMPTKGMVIDHINGSGLDNRRQNLRMCTARQNNANSIGRKNKWGYRGVCFEQKRWRACISVNYKTIKSRSCETIIEAAREHDKLSLKHNGEFAKLNFPRSDYV